MVFIELQSAALAPKTKNTTKRPTRSEKYIWHFLCFGHCECLFLKVEKIMYESSIGQKHMKCEKCEYQCFVLTPHWLIPSGVKLWSWWTARFHCLWDVSRYLYLKRQRWLKKKKRSTFVIFTLQVAHGEQHLICFLWQWQQTQRSPLKMYKDVNM